MVQAEQEQLMALALKLPKTDPAGKWSEQLQILLIGVCEHTN